MTSEGLVFVNGNTHAYVYICLALQPSLLRSVRLIHLKQIPTTPADLGTKELQRKAQLNYKIIHLLNHETPGHLNPLLRISILSSAHQGSVLLRPSRQTVTLH
jgi:hypothetical protein